MSGSKKKTTGSNFDHTSEGTRVRKIIGQLEGVEKMIASSRPPLQLIQQVKAASSALMALRLAILKRHIDVCLSEVDESGNHSRLLEQILEAIQMQSVR